STDRAARDGRAGLPPVPCPRAPTRGGRLWTGRSSSVGSLERVSRGARESTATGQRDLGSARGRHLVAVIETVHRAPDVGGAIALELVGHGTAHPGDVPDVVELEVAALEARQVAGVAHPVGDDLD